MALQPSLKLCHPTAGLQRALLHVIKRNQIDVAGHSPQMAGQQIRLPIVVIHTVHHSVFVRDPSACPFKVTPATGKQLRNSHRAIYRHQLRPGLIIRRVQ